jgi:hypothetical protein
MKKLITGLGLAAIAALALSAFVAPTSAFAVSALCSNSGTGAQCAGGGATDKELTAGDTIHAVQEGSVKLTSGFVTVTCTESTVSLSLTSNTPPVGKITALTFSKCFSNFNTTEGSCTASTTASPTNGWPVTATTTTAPNGKMVVENATGSFTCNILGSNTTCIYAAAKVGEKEELKITGGETAHVDAANVTLTKEAGSAGSCSENATWEGTYKVDSPDSLYMT